MMKNSKPLNKFFRLFTLSLTVGIVFLSGCSLQKESFFFVPKPLEQSPAGSLLAHAKQAIAAGQFNQAEIYVERALRVDPRDATLWHVMGQVKSGQHNYAQTVQFCLKSNSLAGRNNNLIQQNWRLIEKAYTEMGQTDKAQEVRLQYL